MPVLHFVQLQMETKILAKRIADIKIRTRSYLNQNEAITAKLMKENPEERKPKPLSFGTGGLSGLR